MTTTTQEERYRVYEFGCPLPITYNPLHAAGLEGADLLEGDPSTPGDRGLVYETFKYAEKMREMEDWRREALREIKRRLAPEVMRLDDAATAVEQERDAKVAILLAMRKGLRKRVCDAELEAEIKRLRAEAARLRNLEREKSKEYRIAAQIKALEHQQCKLKADQRRTSERLGQTPKSTLDKLKKVKAQLKDLRKTFASFPEDKRQIATQIAEESSQVGLECNSIRRDAYGESDLMQGTLVRIAEEVAKCREKGGPAEKPKRYEGTGAFTLQLQKRKYGYLTIERLFNGEEHQSCIQLTRLPDAEPRPSRRGRPLWEGENLTPKQKREQRGSVKRGEPVMVGGTKKPKPRYMLRFRVTKSGKFAHIPVTIHSPERLHPQAEVRFAHLRRRHHRNRKQWLLQLSVCDRHTRVEVGEHTVGIDFGWRLKKDGLRVAYFVGSDGEHGEIIIPMDMIDKRMHCDTLQANRDIEFNKAKKFLKAFLKSQRGVPQWLRTECKSLSHWRSAKKLAKVVWKWGENRFRGDAEAFEHMDWWRRDKNKHLYDWEICQLRRLCRRRDDMYRKDVAELRKQYGVVKIQDLNLQKLLRRPNAEDSGESSEIKYLMAFASVGKLRTIFEQSGMQVQKFQAPNLTATCHVCGHVNKKNMASSIVQTCDQCGAEWDQDANAAANLLMM